MILSKISMKCRYLYCKGCESINCIQYTTFYSNYDDSAPSHSYALKLKSLEIAFGDGIITLHTSKY